MSSLATRFVPGSRIGGHPESPDVGGRWLNDIANLARPAFQRLALFGLIAMDVVDFMQAVLRMPDDELGNERGDAERRQFGARGSSQIVKPPFAQARRGQLGTACVDRILELAEAFDRRAAAVGRE